MNKEGLEKIDRYMHCGRCLQEVSARGDVTPADYQRLTVGLTADRKMVVGCERHDKILLEFDAPKGAVARRHTHH